MGAKWKAAFAMILFSAAVCAGFGIWKYQAIYNKEKMVWHHELASVADSTLGSDTVPADFMVDESFTSHLPLIVIDTGLEELTAYKYYDLATDSFRYYDDVDPYYPMEISVFDSQDHKNSLTKEPDLKSNGKIKVRGNSSSVLAKQQFRLHLLDEDGEKLEYPLLGMDSGAEWVLNGALRDSSYLRNYMGYGFGHLMQETSPETRFCEVLYKVGNKYKYQGLYLLIEPVEQGEGRVNIEKYQPDMAESSYIVRRDREDPSEIALHTYADTTGIADSWKALTGVAVQLSLVYPKENKVTPETLEYITNDISKVEQILYSDDMKKFAQYPSYLDVDSFVDYFLLKEFMMSYDAGLHSTYMYKDKNGKINMGPFWDFDGGVDNSGKNMTNVEYIVMFYRPWFERLITSSLFRKKIDTEYKELRKNELSDEHLKELIDGTISFLGNAIKRDRIRWSKEYYPRLAILEETPSGLRVNRNRETVEEEVQRYTDTLLLHAKYLDENLSTDMKRFERNNSTYTMIIPAILAILAFFVSIILVQRMRRGLR